MSFPAAWRTTLPFDSETGVSRPIAFEDIPGGAKGYFSPVENRIAIQAGMSEIRPSRRRSTKLPMQSSTLLIGLSRNPLENCHDQRWRHKRDFLSGFASETEANEAAEREDGVSLMKTVLSGGEVEEDTSAVQEMRKDRHTKEVEAESVAYTVCQRYGIETSDYSFGYIAGWSSDKEPGAERLTGNHPQDRR